MEYSVQDVFNKFGNIYLDKYNDGYSKLNVFNNIIACRTKKMGVNIYKCSDCGRQLYVYRSCMDRHCPNCLDYKKEVWIEKHKNDILIIRYKIKTKIFVKKQISFKMLFFLRFFF